MTGQVGRLLVGRYRLLAPIGAGASASVFLAEDVSLRRSVAVKLLHGALVADEGFLRRFRAEARTAAGLSHPNIVAVHDWGEGDQGAFLVLELLRGGSLRGLLDRGHRLSPAQAAFVGSQAARGLDHAHRRGLVHRDVKPANLLFDEEGNVRIADFGVARALAAAAWTEPAGIIIGSARYASPEQAQGRSLDGRSDVYSLALVLIEAVTGQLPFAADTAIGTLMARVDTPVVAPRALGPLVPVVDAATRLEQAERLDAAALHARLDAVMAQLPRPARLCLPDTLPEPLMPPDDPTALQDLRDGGDGERRHRRHRIDVASVPASTEGKDQAVGEGGDEPASPPGAPRHDRRRPWALRRLLAAAAVALGLLGLGLGVVWASLPTHLVPAVKDLSEEQARAALRARGFQVRVQREYVDATSEGSVVSQAPSPGTRLKERRRVTLLVSRGPPFVTVPELAGLDRQEALGRLSAAGLSADERAQPDENVRRGTVLSTVGAGQRVRKGSAVTVVVSAGPPKRTVPDLQGTTLEEAMASLARLGISAVPGEGYSDQVRPGQVFATTPPAGASVDKGSQVTVRVSKGPATVVVPRVVGSSIEGAKGALEAAGLAFGGVYGPTDKVVFSNPPAGSKARRGTKVVLYTG